MAEAAERRATGGAFEEVEIPSLPSGYMPDLRTNDSNVWLLSSRWYS